jgi:uncharacterized oligopeptide transporter (OPT) family protein
MTAMEVRANYVYYIGAGAVTMAGLISLGRSLPTIWGALAGGLGRGRAMMQQGAKGTATRRTMRDLPMSLVAGGALAAVAAMVVLPQIGINIAGALLALFFAFLFVTVSSRITGQIGASSNPISGMTVATVLFTALIFLAVGWTGIEHRVLALSIGGVVCVAASVAGATSQDLKTGFLVGATPARQQIGLLFGVVSSAVLIGFTIHSLDAAATTYVVRDYPGVTARDVEAPALALEGDQLVERPNGTLRMAHLYEQTGVAPAGRYLVDATGRIRYLVDPGIGGQEATSYTGHTVKKLDSPKAQIMRLVVDGILTQKLSWGLILVGAFFAIALEILGVPSLPVAVGVYLPISTSATMFMGGCVRWLAERSLPSHMRDGPAADSGPGVLLSSGLIAGGAITGIVLAALTARGLTGSMSLEETLGTFATNPAVAIVAFLLCMAAPLYVTARRARTEP